ncbi:uncharacterized protein LOC111100709 isoform X3 [Crassostrea virginica]
MPPKRKRNATMISPSRGRGFRKPPPAQRQKKPRQNDLVNIMEETRDEGQPSFSQEPQEIRPTFGLPEDLVGQIQTVSADSRPLANTTAPEHLGHLRSEANKLIQGTAYRTAILYISALSYIHKIRGIQDNTQSFIVKKALQGLHRSRGVTADPRTPLTLSILQLVVSALPSVCRSPYEAVLFSTLFSCAYYGLLRVSEVLNIQKAHISLSNFKVSILIPRSKTDQFGNTTTLHISKQPNSLTCPVHWILKFLRLRPDNAPSFFFIHIDKKGVTRYQFNFLLQKAIQFHSIQGHFRPHSFRIGRATDLAKQGVPDSEIKVLGRWDSKAFQNYIRL